ncbi:PDZ domain-containing protein [bacterium]|nr:PDZ domain-containing protein [bacterium]
MVRARARVLVGVGLSLGALAGAALLRADDSRREGPAGSPLQRAIERVYPALVQIHVLSLAHEGGHERKQEGAGSGAIISPDGYVVTNHHVAGKAAVIRVILSSKEELDAKLVGTDALADIAVVKLDLSARPAGSPALPVAKFGRSELLKVGDTVLAIGCPRALSHSVTRGTVANKEMMMPRFVRGSPFILDGEDVGSIVKWIGHDATIQPGNSGGPLVNLEGEIIGINEIGIGTMAGAIPSEIANAVSKELIEHGKVRRAWIGVDLQPLLKNDVKPLARGALVGSVTPGSPAEVAGLKPGDIVLAIDDSPVHVVFREELPEVNMRLLAEPVGKDVVLKVRRGGEELTLAVKPESRDDVEGKETEARAWGATVRELTTFEAKEQRRGDKRGILVGSVRQGGPCDQAQPPIHAGDVIVDVGGKTIEGLESFSLTTASLQEGKTDPIPTLVTYERGTLRLLTLVEVGARKPMEPTPEARKPWLGIETQVLSKKLASALGLKGKKGVRVSQVYPETTAALGGLKVGDIVTHVDGKLVEASEQHDADVFNEIIRGYKPGAKAELTVIRGSEKLALQVALEEAPRPERELKEHEDAVLELKLRDLSFWDRVRNRWKKEEPGALVSGLESGGWAAFAGIHAGDLLQAIDGRPVSKVEDAIPLLESIHEKRPRTIVFLVKRGIHTVFVEIEPTWPIAATDKK